MKLPKRKETERLATHVYDVRELLDVMQAHGDRVLFTCFRGKTTEDIPYAGFVSRVYDTAAGLMALGLGGARVAVIGESSPEWFETYLAVLLTGGVIIPMDKELSIPEIYNFLKIAEARAIVYADHFKEQFGAFTTHPTLEKLIPMTDGEYDDGHYISLPKVRAHGASAPTSPVFPKPDREKMSEMLFTSGTTGTSKCVALSQKNVFAAVNAAAFGVEFFPDDVVVSVLPVHHTYELMCNLAEMDYGHHIVINDNLRHVMRNFQKYRPTGLVLVPMFLTTMYKRIWAEAEKQGKTKKLKAAIKLSRALLAVGIDVRRSLFKDVRAAFGGDLDHVICGGAALNPALIRGFEDFGISVYEGYGITECSPLAAVTPYTHRKPGSVGQAVPCCEIRIAKTGKNDLGFPEGEIQVKGDNVMLGYVKNDEANAAAFTEDGWFRTGDFGYMDGEGFVYITGRLKSVIVLENGKNVFPEEMEEYLASVEEIEECVVVGRTAEDGTVSLVVVAVPNKEKFPEGTEEGSMHDAIFSKIEAINRNLPSFKQMRTLELRSEPFEKTSSRKIKRHLVK